MRSFKEIKHDYRFTEDDEYLLATLRPLMQERAEEIMGTIHQWFLGTTGARKQFKDDALQRHVFKTQKEWFLELFSGNYGTRYHERLMRIGNEHVRRSIDIHYMHRVVSIIKNSCTGLLSQVEEDRVVATNKIISVGKILDISLDVIVSSYVEEEMRIYSPVYKFKSALINFSEKFSQTTNFILVFALIGLTLGVVWLFATDVMHLFDGDIERGIISALGSMLLLWLMIELMSTEIAHLKGGKFHISVFVGVALVTMIRETMIATLRHERPESVYYLVAAILVIGFVYWIVTRAEERER
jgi:uncharacterized membrane protein (DUF373 family)